MSNKKWVQHISGQGEKWEVDDECHYDGCWSVFKKKGRLTDHYFLPLSEYRLCEPPEEWEDVTFQTRVVHHGEHSGLVCDGEAVRIQEGKYRLLKVELAKPEPNILGYSQQWAFVVERRKS